MSAYETHDDSSGAYPGLYIDTTSASGSLKCVILSSRLCSEFSSYCDVLPRQEVTLKGSLPTTQVTHQARAYPGLM